MKKIAYILLFFISAFIFKASGYSQSASLSGSIFTNNLESNIRTGNETIEISLAGDMWQNEIGGDNPVTNELINGISGDQNWSVVLDRIDYSHVERVDDQLVRITLPPATDYYLNSDETVTVTIPPSCFVFNFLFPVNAEPDILIRNETPSISISGSIQDNTANSELDIRLGYADIVLTLEGDQWDPAIGTNSTLNQDLISSISGSDSWNTNVINTILGTDNGATNVSKTGNLVTITIPPVPDYDIFSEDNITTNVPSQILNFTGSGEIAGSPDLIVVPVEGTAEINDPGLTESALDGAELTLTLYEEKFKNTFLEAYNFTHNGPSVISIDAVQYVSETEAILSLGLNGDITEDINDFKITVSRDELTSNSSITTNGILIQSEDPPSVTNVTIEQGTYIVGETVRVLIYVEDDGGKNYSYQSGTVAGKTLSNLQRESSTQYSASFVVAEGDQSYTAAEPIPVTNLQLLSGTLPSNIYNGVIDNNSTIDAESPYINYMQAPSGIKIVGERVDIIVSADGTGYSPVESETRVNNISITEPNVSLVELGNGVYILRYVVEEGNNDVSSGSLTASLQLRDQSGNLSNIKTTFVSNTVTIDANSPSVSSITVDDGLYNAGDVIEVTINADGADYVATNETTVNSISLSSSYLSFSNPSGNQYKLYYTIRSVDPEVLKGQLKVVVYLKDEAGNIGGPYSEVEPNSLSIYTALPSAILSGDRNICEGEEAILNVSLTGRAPWRIYVSDGSSTTEYNVNSSPYDLRVSPDITTNYRIDSVLDVNGISNDGAGAATVTVRERTDVEIINLNSTYFVEADPVKLEADPSGGTFTGPGVNSSTSYFDPGIADTVNSPHTIYYSYRNASGCTSVDSALVFVLGAEGDIYIPESIYCDYDEPFTISASNNAGVTGSFELFNSDSEPVSGLIDNGDNTAKVDPGILADGLYRVAFTYTDETLFVLRKTFNIESAGEASILIPDRNEYCQNEPEFDMSASDPSAIFEGPGVTGNVNDGFVFNPDSAYIGNNTIKLTNTSSNGCENSVSMTITIKKMPGVEFTAGKLCINNYDTVKFTNTTQSKNQISEWQWNFDDPESGENNFSYEESPGHVFSEPGTKNIKLKGIAENGCVDSLVKVIEFQGKPAGSFRLESECFQEGRKVNLTSTMESSSEITSYVWTITSPEGTYENFSGESSIEYTFESMDPYIINHYAETGIGCSEVAERSVSLKPTIILSDTSAYLQDFSADNVPWSTSGSYASDYNSWEYNTVNFEGIADSLSSRAWYTNVPGYPVLEQSWVKSPCYNFENMERPMISLDIYRSLSKNDEGAVVQISQDGGQNWETLGEYKDGINWYNSDIIDFGPENGSVGWTGTDPFSADNGWVNAKHDLDIAAGKSEVLFRVFFSSSHTSDIQNREGFAFDNFLIKERNKKVLLEHFTNTSSTDTRVENGLVNALYNTNFQDLVKLEYHTAFPGYDPFNEANKSVPATRALYYGVSQVPYSIIDGGINPSFKFDFDPEIPARADVKIASLEEGLFTIDIIPEYSSGQLTAEIQITSLADLPAEERIIHVVIYEKLISGVTVANGATKFLNVVKAMLPNSAGTAIFDDWQKGQTRSFQFNWDYQNVYDPEMLRIAAFIQNDETREIYQVDSDDDTNLSTPVDKSLAESRIFSIYPNPAGSSLYINILNPDEKEYELELFDQLGRSIKKSTINSYEKLKRIDLSDIERGIYFIKISEEDITFKIERILIMR